MLDRLDELVVKPVDGSGGKGIVIGPRRDRGRARRAAHQGPRRPARLDRPAGRPALDGPDVRRRRARAAARRPAPVRGQRRPAGVGAARRPHPGRARRGRADRELLARRRLQGHLGAGRRPADRAPARGAEPADRVGSRRAAERRSGASTRSPASARPGSSSSSNSSRPRRGGGADAEPDRGVDVLDRPLRRARRGHRAHPRRADPAAARGPADRRGRRPAGRCSSIMGVELEPEDRRRRGDGARASSPTTPTRPPRSPPRSAPPARAPAGPARRCRSPMWEALNTTYRAIAVGPVPVACGRRCVFHWVRERAALINGTADATMTRDEGWQFLMLGRCIERADMTSRLVATASLAGGVGRAVDQHAARVRRLRGLPAHLPRPGDRARRRRSSCCSTGCSRARSCSRSTAPSSASTTSSRRASGPASRTRRSGCSAAPAPSSSTARSSDVLADLPARDGAAAAHLRDWRPRRSRAATSPAPRR